MSQNPGLDCDDRLMLGSTKTGASKLDVTLKSLQERTDQFWLNPGVDLHEKLIVTSHGD
jgi:hypothetical protein